MNVELTPAVGHNELLGHAVRLEEWDQQGESTYARVRHAVARGDAETAASLVELIVQEAWEAFDLYTLWLEELPTVLADLGASGAPLDAARGHASRTARDLERGWGEYLRHLRSCRRHALAGNSLRAKQDLETARSIWQSVHDPATDALCALIAVGVREVGESCVGPLWDRLLAHYYTALPQKYDPALHPWSRSLERLVLDIFEATRGHLSGPGRDGAFDVWEEPDRWVVRFAPCGSGGRTYDGPESTSGRTFTESEHDWAWRKAGVCHYCVHCCQLQQRAPIAHLGMPLRVIEPPLRQTASAPARDHCTWSLYKDPSLLPPEAFTSVGAPVPSWLLPDARP